MTTSSSSLGSRLPLATPHPRNVPLSPVISGLWSGYSILFVLLSTRTSQYVCPRTSNGSTLYPTSQCATRLIIGYVLVNDYPIDIFPSSPTSPLCPTTEYLQQENLYKSTFCVLYVSTFFHRLSGELWYLNLYP